MKDGKTTGIDGILPEFLNNLVENMPNLLCEINTKSYETRDINKKIVKNKIITYKMNNYDLL